MTFKSSNKLRAIYLEYSLKHSRNLKLECNSHHKAFCTGYVSSWFSLSAPRPPQVEAGLQTWEITEAADTQTLLRTELTRGLHYTATKATKPDSSLAYISDPPQS